MKPINAARFWSRVDRRGPNVCWPIRGYKDKDGYGQFNGERAHRVAYELVNGPLPDGLGALHRCDNPPCCNPAHLFAGANIDNVADRDSKGRQARGHSHAVSRSRCSTVKKISDADVLAIRRRYRRNSSTDGTTAIARDCGVTPYTIGQIVRGKRRIVAEEVACA